MDNLRDILVVCASADEYIIEAQELSEHLGVEMIREDVFSEISAELMIRVDEEGLTLTDGSLSMRGDLSNMIPRVKTSNMQKEMLVKAARFKGADNGYTAVDATAGMGEDSVLLAAAGFDVTMFELNPVIAALLKDSIRRAKDIPELSDIVDRMHVIEGNSIEKMRALDFEPDMILLDPMFPARQKSALVKKKFQLLHHLEMPCAEEGELLQSAIDAKPRKIVIKRPVKGPYLAGMKPSHSYSGKAIRYDCLVYARS